MVVVAEVAARALALAAVVVAHLRRSPRLPLHLPVLAVRRAVEAQTVGLTTGIAGCPSRLRGHRAGEGEDCCR